MRMTDTAQLLGDGWIQCDAPPGDANRLLSGPPGSDANHGGVILAVSNA